MINIGKPLVPVVLPSGDIYIFFNDYNSNMKAVTWYESDGTTEVYKFADPPTKLYRYLQYKRYLPQYQIIEEKSRMIPLIMDNTDQTASIDVEPLYEAINPVGNYITGRNIVTLAFWTNLKDNDGEFTVASGYDATKILKLEQDKLSSVVPLTKPTRVICATQIEFKLLMYKEAGETTSHVSFVPVAHKPVILEQKKGQYPIFDFSGGGSGGSSIGLHNHASNELRDGGFAFAVFHPGTAVPQIPWIR